MKRIFLLIIGILIFVSACGKEPPETETEEKVSSVMTETLQGGVVRVSSRKPDTFNPLATNYESCRELFYLFYDGLYTLNEDFTVTENLASEFIMKEGFTWGTLKIKDGILFADGSLLTCSDIIYSVDFIKRNGGSFSGCVKNIKSITEESSNTLLIELYNPESNFEAMLTFPIIKDGSPYFMDMPNGTGQFYCEEGDLGYTHLKASKNLSYHQGRAYIDEIEILYMNTDLKEEMSFLSGDTDLIINPDFTDEQKENPGIKTYKSGSNRFEFLGFNSTNGVFTDEAARRAVASAVDRGAIKDEFKNIETVASTPINPKASFYTEEVETVTFDKAADVLERNGWRIGDGGVYEKNGRSLSFSIIVNEDDSERVAVANFLSHALLSHGISASLQPLSYDTYKERLKNGEFEAFMGGCTIGNASNLGFLIGTGGSANVFGYSGGVMDMRIAALATAEGENLLSEAKKFGKALGESAPLTGIYFKTTKIMAKNNIMIPEISPTSFYTKAYKWYYTK